mmetsp:Transcript_13345/g.56404  ORF Transcript_13345/g.56404 Transcript_13345/m.56404 type:complete len:400 (+) Transcript_13345:3895-5094(+)
MSERRGAHAGHESSGWDAARTVVSLAQPPPAKALRDAVDDRLERPDALDAAAHLAHGLASSSGLTLPPRSAYSSTSAARSESGSGMARAASSERFEVTLKLRTLRLIPLVRALASASSSFAPATQCGHAVETSGAPASARARLTSAQHSRQKSFSHPSQCLKQSAMLFAHRSHTSRYVPPGISSGRSSPEPSPPRVLSARICSATSRMPRLICSSAYLAIAFAACASTPELSDGATGAASVSIAMSGGATETPLSGLRLAALRPPPQPRAFFSADRSAEPLPGDGSLPPPLPPSLPGVLVAAGSPRAGLLLEPRVGGGGISAGGSLPPSGAALLAGFSALLGAAALRSALAFCLPLRSRYLFTAVTDLSDFMFSPLAYSPIRLQSWKGCSSRVAGSNRL